MKKNILIISSSPRTNGNSDILANEFARGAEAAGHNVEKYNLNSLKINPCIGCEYCHEKSNGRCIHNDDMEKILVSMSNSNVLVMASPVYFYDVCAQLKTFIDRTYSKFYVDMKTFNFTESVFICTSEANEKMFDIPVLLYRNYISSFNHNVENKGEILAGGVHAKGQVSEKKDKKHIMSDTHYSNRIKKEKTFITLFEYLI